MAEFNSGALTLVDSAIQEFLNGTQDWDTDDHYVIMLKNTYVFNSAHGTLADLSSHEVTEPSYGPENMTGETVTVVGGVTQCDAADMSWGPNVSFTAYYLAILVGTVAAKASGDKLVGVMALSGGGVSPVIVDNGTLTVNWNADGLFRVQQGDTTQQNIEFGALPTGRSNGVVTRPINRATGIDAHAGSSPFDATKLIEVGFD